MSKNIMKIIASELGLSIGDEFKLFIGEHAVDDNYYTMELDGIKKFGEANSIAHLLEKLSLGVYSAMKISKTPYNGQYFYTVNPKGNIIGRFWYKYNINDFVNYKLGNCFLEEEDITQEIIDKYVTFYASDEIVEF